MAGNTNADVGLRANKTISYNVYINIYIHIYLNIYTHIITTLQHRYEISVVHVEPNQLNGVIIIRAIEHMIITMLLC